jgi:hypothetical protein
MAITDASCRRPRVKLFEIEPMLYDEGSFKYHPYYGAFNGISNTFR